MVRTAAQAARLARDLAVVADLLGRATPVAIARRIGRSEKGLRKMLERQGLSPTLSAGYVTAQTLAREFVALTPQRVTALCRAGAIPARRNPGGRWWLINLDRVPELQARYGARGCPVRWRAGCHRGAHREAA